ncbi:hypothetical protein PQX77_003479 [Marasmius sp. AFHP31]|nr:hypothetical protein PQX77_003479 [Marasmius sp. AFHP31]
MFIGSTVVVSFILILLSYRGVASPAFISEKGQDGIGPSSDHLPGFEDGPLERNWAMYSPAWPVEEYKTPVRGCQVNQVHILQRHGARYPTSGASKTIMSALEKLKTAGSDVHPSLAFLKNYTYVLGVADLVTSGAEQLYNSGVTTYKRYEELVKANQNSPPFIRASLSERVVYSASNWSAGFSDANRITEVPISVLMPEEASFNSTLDHNNCPAEGDSDEQTQEWTSVFAPAIAARLAPSANLTNDEVYALMSLCPFETAAIGGNGDGEKGLGYGGHKTSPWCGALSHKEFEMFEYEGDVDKFFNTGPGSNLGRVQGVGYVNELIARLTSQPVVDSTTTNHTLTSSPETFPLDKTIYADFSHDNQMIAIYTALGLLDDYAAPSPSGPQKEIDGKRWRTSELAPFAATMVVERLGCGDVGTYVRVLVNDKVQPLEFCGAPADSSISGLGMCELGRFIETQGYSVRGGDGDFAKCFEV